MSQWIKILAFVTTLTLPSLFSCSKSSSDDAAGTDGLGATKIWKASAADMSVTFDGSDTGQQYIIAPYILGNTSSVDGSGSTKLPIKITGGTAMSLDGKSFVAQHTANYDPVKRMSRDDFQHGLRVLANRFDPDRGDSQSVGFWELTQALDQVDEVVSSPGAGFADVTVPDSRVEQFFRKQVDDVATDQAQGFSELRSMRRLADSTNCPTTVPVPVSSFIDLKNLTVTSSYDGTSYCLVYLATPVSEPSQTNIQASVTKIMNSYKTNIYNDQFADANGYSFKPLIIIADLTDTNYWVPASVLPFPVDGMFVGSISKQLMRPTFYIASDISKVDSTATGDTARARFHTVIAHEMQHAIMNYYRIWKNQGNIETVAVDEGLAHFMQDVFGFGETGFPLYAKKFLSTTYDGPKAALYSDSNANSASGRGAAHAFVYYLASQKGGVNFSNGSVSGGAGIDFIKSIVTASTTGVKTLSTVYGGDWTTTFGNYIAALMVDGSTTYDTIPNADKVEDTSNLVTNALGSQQHFGMHYNNYLGLGTPETRKKDLKASNDQDAQSSDAPYYNYYPFIHTIKDSSATLKVNFSDSTNAGMAVIRIK